MNVGKALFAQIMDFVPWTSVSRIVDRHAGNAGVRRLTCAEQFRALAFSQLTWRESLRDIEATLGANANKLYAMGLRHRVRRSTLADANEWRDWRIWSDVAALLDLRGAIPAFIHISDGKMHDVNVLDILTVEAGAFYVMDRGYLDFARLYQMHQGGAFFLTRAKRGMDARRVYSNKTDRSTGVICDQRIVFNGFYTSKHYPEHLRRIRFKDPETGKTLVSLTNNTTLPALTIAALYKSRWQVELFFKWIKQHLRIKKFLGTSENAVKTQIWCAVAVYVLIAIIKKELQIKASLYTMLQILSVSVFEKTPINKAFLDATDTTEPDVDDNQLNLFNY